MTDGGRRPRIAVYCQHLSGVGHFVRSRELCRALAPCCDVLFVCGGVPVPGPGLGPNVRMLSLPPLRRDGATGQLVAAASGESWDRIESSRSSLLTQAVTHWIPDAVLVEHFPVSKWELSAEILGWIETCRAANPHLLVCCSLRDFPATNELLQAGRRSQDWIVDTLETRFAAVLVHSDPTVSQLREDCPWADRLTIPVVHTGYVVEEPFDSHPAVDIDSDDPQAPVLVSAGGLDDGDRLSELCIAAWEILHHAGKTAGRRLVVIAPFQTSPARLDRLAGRLAPLQGEISPFRDDFLSQVWGCGVSISQAGYNTTMNILRSGCRAIVAPNPRMHDQVVRSALLEQRGLLSRLDVGRATAEDLARMIIATLQRPRPRHSLQLNGAERTTEWLCEQLGLDRQRPGASP